MCVEGDQLLHLLNKTTAFSHAKGPTWQMQIALQCLAMACGATVAAHLLCSASEPMLWSVPGTTSDQSLLVISFTARPVR